MSEIDEETDGCYESWLKYRVKVLTVRFEVCLWASRDADEASVKD